MEFYIKDKDATALLDIHDPKTGQAYLGDVIAPCTRHERADIDEGYFVWNADMEMWECTKETFEWWENWVEVQKAIERASEDYGIVWEEEGLAPDMEFNEIHAFQESVIGRYRFNYAMLSRLKQDCDYYLGNGNRAEKHLWASSSEEQIEKMKEIWNGLNSKPEWMTMEDIEEYGRRMLPENDELSKWVQTDEMQWVRKNGFGDYTVIQAQLVSVHPEEPHPYSLICGDVRLSEWTESEIEDIVATFYASMDEFTRLHPESEGGYRNQLIAECIFETHANEHLEKKIPLSRQQYREIELKTALVRLGYMKPKEWEIQEGAYKAHIAEDYKRGGYNVTISHATGTEGRIGGYNVLSEDEQGAFRHARTNLSNLAKQDERGTGVAAAATKAKVASDRPKQKSR